MPESGGGSGPNLPPGLAEQMFEAPRSNEVPTFGENPALPPLNMGAFEEAAERLRTSQEQHDAVPAPENVLISVLMQLQTQELRLPVDALNHIQGMLEAGQVSFRYDRLSALHPENSSGTPEWRVIIQPTAPRNLPPGYLDQDALVEQEDGSEAEVEQDTEKLDIRAQGQGVKREYSWEELREFTDEELIRLGTSREQVEGMAALARQATIPEDVRPRIGPEAKVVGQGGYTEQDAVSDTVKVLADLERRQRGPGDIGGGAPRISDYEEKQ